MHKHLFLFLLITLSTDGFAQRFRVNAAGLRAGFTVGDYDTPAEAGYNGPSRVDLVGLNIAVAGTTGLLRFERLSFSYGLGYSYREVSLSPMLQLRDTDIPHSAYEDTFYVGKVYQAVRVFTVPLEARFRLLDDFLWGGMFTFPAIHAVIGVENAFVLHRHPLESEVYAAIDPENDLVQLYPQPESLSQGIHDHYRDRFRTFSFAGYGGLQFEQPAGNERIRFSGALHYYLPLLPFYKGVIRKPTGMNAFIGVTYVFNDPL
jgi:hypothetical protein